MAAAQTALANNFRRIAYLLMDSAEAQRYCGGRMRSIVGLAPSHPPVPGLSYAAGGTARATDRLSESRDHCQIGVQPNAIEAAPSGVKPYSLAACSEAALWALMGSDRDPDFVQLPVP
jgi:hypothetical protein